MISSSSDTLKRTKLIAPAPNLYLPLNLLVPVFHWVWAGVSASLSRPARGPSSTIMRERTCESARRFYVANDEFVTDENGLLTVFMTVFDEDVEERGLRTTGARLNGHGYVEGQRLPLGQGLTDMFDQIGWHQIRRPVLGAVGWRRDERTELGGRTGLRPFGQLDDRQQFRSRGFRR